MSWRLLFGIFAVVIALGLNLYLLSAEEISSSEQQVRHSKSVEDPLLDLTYVSGNRESNFKAFGLDEGEVKQATKRVGDLQDLYADRLVRLLDQAPEPVELADDLCGTSRGLPSRYAAMHFVVAEKGGERIPVDFRRYGGFKRQEWSFVATISAVYQEVELREDRQEDATRMGIAAVLAAQEALVLDNRTPWGRGLAPGTWSWDKVESQFPGVHERTIKYLSMMHLTLELARADGGICGN